MIRRVLVTNDDGVESEGLHRLALMAGSAGVEVVVAAPQREASGSSASLKAAQKDGQVIVESRRIPALGALPVYAVSAAPAYITLIGLHGAFGDPVDMVLSGINKGPNTGRAILHSGTVGAALTALSQRRPALAVSIDIGSRWYWDTAISVAAKVFESMLDVDRPVACNVNVPNVAPDMVKGLRRAPLATFGAVQTRVKEVGQGVVRTSVTAIDPSSEPASDAGLLAQGFATLTFLQAVCETAPPAGWRVGEPAAVADERPGEPGEPAGRVH